MTVVNGQPKAEAGEPAEELQGPAYDRNPKQ